eukprot:TRINITY_DN366_c0_g1_i4.p1 TRINITY_DN366_c0_g1~~TRINITY_DN366_c0_g1_i4.p1  ORF type:complete len:266 (-),score=45.83 TRINITY_DN366_c0_g1_i4:100-864(-)
MSYDKVPLIPVQQSAPMAPFQLVDSHYGYLDPQPEGIKISQDLVCSICQSPFTNAVRSSSCGHTFCRNCILRWAETNNTCPLDHTPLQTLQWDRVANSLTNELAVSCTVCYQWRGSKDEISQHLKDVHRIESRSESELSTIHISPPQQPFQNLVQGQQQERVVIVYDNQGVGQGSNVPCCNHPDVPSIHSCKRCTKRICLDCTSFNYTQMGQLEFCPECIWINRKQVVIILVVTFGFSTFLICAILGLSFAFSS